MTESCKDKHSGLRSFGNRMKPLLANELKFQKNWTPISDNMRNFLELDQSKSWLNRKINETYQTLKNQSRILKKHRKVKPHILMLVDQPNWAFDINAREIVKILNTDFNFDIKYVKDSPIIIKEDYDLFYIFFWGEQYYKKFNLPPDRLIKQVASHRWIDDPRYGPKTPQQFVHQYLNDAAAVCCTSEKLFSQIKNFHSNVFQCPNGYNSNIFNFKNTRKGPLTIGWAGNIDDPVKGFNDILKPACEGRFRLMVAPGSLSHSKMNDFYNKLDVLVVCSIHEGEPLTLIESMAAGCFPVCVDVGIVPELVQHEKNGLIVNERSSKAFHEAFHWCEKNIEFIRSMGKNNADYMIRERTWKAMAPYFKKVFIDTLEKSISLNS